MCNRDNSISCGPDYGVDWGFSGAEGWRMTEKEGNRWSDIGPMNKNGRRAVLKHYHLEGDSAQLPLTSLRVMSPEMLKRLASPRQQFSIAA